MQDVYLHLLQMKDLEKIIYSERDLNLYYIYKLVRSKFINSTNKRKKLDITKLDEDLQEYKELEEYNLDKDSNTERLLQLIDHRSMNNLLLFYQ